MGVVYYPPREFFFYSGGEWRVSQTRQLAEAMIALDWPGSDEAREDTLRLAAAITHHARTLRSLGSAALSLCDVAGGWLDGFIHADIEPWDAAAGALIVRESGGKVTDFEGRPWRLASRQLVASNGLLHDEILAII